MTVVTVAGVPLSVVTNVEVSVSSSEDVDKLMTVVNVGLAVVKIVVVCGWNKVDVTETRVDWDEEGVTV